MSGPPDIGLAEQKVEAARAQLKRTIGEIQYRLSPATLAQNAMDSTVEGVTSVARKGAEAVRTRPVATAAVTGALGLFLARGWIGDILGLGGKRHATPGADEGLEQQDKHAKGTAR